MPNFKQLGSIIKKSKFSQKAPINNGNSKLRTEQSTVKQFQTHEKLMKEQDLQTEVTHCDICSQLPLIKAKQMRI